MKDILAELKAEEKLVYDDPTLKVEAEVTLYKVYALGKASSISKLKLTTVSLIKENDIGLFFYPKGEAQKNSYDSLSDMGVVDNEYNDHQTFEHPMLANLYLEDCKKSEKLEARIQRDWKRQKRYDNYMDY